MSAAVVNITLNRLIEEFFKVGAAHKMIETTFYGDFLNIVSSNRVKYCSLLVNTADGTISKSYIEFRVEIAVMDKVFNDQSNLNDVESDTAQILQDLYSVIDYSNRWQSFAKITNASAPIRKFISKGQDVVTGWSMTLNIGVKRRNGICNIPIEDYDYQGNYAAYCAGVRIFQDNILVEVVPSGGRFDYSGTVVPITITVNGDIFYTDVTTNQEIPVKDEGGVARGSKVGINWVIADADQTFNGVDVIGQRPETTKAVVVQTVDAVPTGDVIEDSLTSLKIEIQNAQVNVNGDAFESIPPDSVLNIPVVDATDVAVGTDTGTKIVIASSVVTLGTQSPADPLTPIRSQQNKTINLVDAIDSDPVQVIVATDTQSLADLIIPNGQVLVKDSAGNTLYTKVVKAGGSANQTVTDATISNSDDSYTSTVAAQGAKELPDITVTINGASQGNSPSVKNLSFNASQIIYFRPQNSGYGTTSFLTGDEGYNEVNYPAPAAPAFGIPAFLDPTDPKKLLNNNAFGHKQRFTGINGGYYDYATSQYKLANGTISDQATTFGTIAANTSYLIDHHTGLGWKWNIQGAAIWSTQVTNILGLTHASYSDYFLPSRTQYRSLFATYNLSLGLSSVIPFNSNGSLKTSTPSFGTEATSHHQLASAASLGTRTDASADAAYACRWHY